jgi:predicted permease
MIPALRASSVGVDAALKSGTALASTSYTWQSRGLVVLQISLSLVLLLVSAMFVRTLVNLRTLDVGFDRRNVVLATVQYRARASDDQLYVAWHELLRRVTAIPGIEAASASVGGPLLPPRRAGEPRIAGAPWDYTLPPSWFVPVSANYLRTFGGSLVKGRDFEPRDFEPTSPAVTIINLTMARRFFGDENPIGRKLNDYGPNPPQDAQMLEIIGVANDMKFDSLRNAPPSMVYVPFTQKGVRLKVGLDMMGLSLRTRHDSGSLERVLRRELAAANPAFNLRSVTTQSKLVDDTLIRERLLATVGSFFGFLALLLAGIGLYGVTSYSVTRRTQEIGIRMALGAGWQRLMRMVVGEALVTAALGAVIGVTAGIFAARVFAGLLFGLKPEDPVTIMLAAGLLLGTSLVAAVVPALRACRASPMDALRTE